MYAVEEMERMVAAVSFSVPSSLKQWSISNAPMPLPTPAFFSKQNQKSTRSKLRRGS